MKTFRFLMAFALLGMGAKVNAQSDSDQPGTDSTGMPGDNLDLYAVMDEFKKSDNLEAFEKSINDPNNKINNLDLNKDGQTDYIKVIDNIDSGAHAIVLQVPVNDKETQDVAVIEVEQQGVENARIQIVGNEDVYGEDYVVEPYENYVSKEEWDAQYSNNTKSYNNSNTRVYVNVYTWPCVTYIYRPVYRPWRSPWYWGYYPGWWRPWRPYHWHAYHGYVGHYHGSAYWYRNASASHHFYASNRVYGYHRTSSATYRRTAPAHTYTHNTNRYNHYNGNHSSRGGGHHSGGNGNYSGGGEHHSGGGNYSGGSNHSGGSGNHSGSGGHHSGGGNYSGGSNHSGGSGNHSGGYSGGGNHSGGGGHHTGGGGNHSGSGGHHSGGGGSYSGGSGHHSGGGGNHSGGGRVRRK